MALGAWVWTRSLGERMQTEEGGWLYPPDDSSTQGSEEWPGRYLESQESGSP